VKGKASERLQYATFGASSESTFVYGYHKAAGRTDISYVNAADNAGVMKFEPYVDGKLEANSAGAHKFQCAAYDTARDAGPSQVEAVYT